MMESKETALWAWLLFDAGIKTYRAKQLLSLLNEKELSLESIIRMPSDQLVSMGLDTYADLLSQFPTLQPYPQAVRWDEPAYPQGLHDLTTKEKPALLFYKGSRDLLSRPIVLLETGEISSQTKDLLIGIVEILLDGTHLPAVFAGSPQETALLELMAYCDGEALIFIDQSLDQWHPTSEIMNHIENGRLLILSPMPPGLKSSPALTRLIQKLAAAAACRWIGSLNNANNHDFSELERPFLQIKTDELPDADQKQSSTFASEISDAINWLQDSLLLSAENKVEVQNKAVGDEDARKVDILPPISSKVALKILESGGKVPEVLRERLMGKNREVD